MPSRFLSEAAVARRGRRGTTLTQLPSLIAERPPEAQLAGGRVFRTEWRDPMDTLPTASRLPRTVSGFRAMCPLRKCRARHHDRCSFREEHILAADRLRLDFDGAVIGFSSLKDWRPVTDAHYRPATGPPATARKQWRCRREFDRAWNMLYADERPVVERVVLRNGLIGETASVLEITQRTMTQMLVGALDRLIKHYDIWAEQTPA
jgi:hypothetical protein